MRAGEIRGNRGAAVFAAPPAALSPSVRAFAEDLPFSACIEGTSAARGDDRSDTRAAKRKRDNSVERGEVLSNSHCTGACQQYML